MEVHDNISKRKRYRYRKLYVYYHHPKDHLEKPKWCYLKKEYLEALGITENTITQRENLLTQNTQQTENPKSCLFKQDNTDLGRGRRLAWSRLRDSGSRDPGSNPGGPTKAETCTDSLRPSISH